MNANINVQDIVKHTLIAEENGQHVEKTVMMASMDINHEAWVLVKTRVNGEQTSIQWINYRFFMEWLETADHLALAS